MNIICEPRQTGKTTKLVKRAAEIDGIIICVKLSSKKNILNIAKELNLKIKEPISISEWMIKKESTVFNSPFLIDNCDSILKFILKNKIDTVSFDSDDGSNLNSF